MPHKRANAVVDWASQFIADHTDPENPDQVLPGPSLRTAVVAIAQFARDSGIISPEEYSHDVLARILDRLAAAQNP